MDNYLLEMEYPVDPYAEAMEFEAGSEDMELRGMRLEAELEAEREAAMEAAYDAAEEEAMWADAYSDYLDATVERGGVVMTEAEFRAYYRRTAVAATVEPVPADVAEDDIPF
jgi:hypothetical protein